jgi:hypothetical protein
MHVSKRIGLEMAKGIRTLAMPMGDADSAIVQVWLTAGVYGVCLRRVSYLQHDSGWMECGMQTYVKVAGESKSAVRLLKGERYRVW